MRNAVRSLSDGAGKTGLVSAVAGSQNLRRVRLSEQVVDDVEESAETVVVIRANRDEGRRDASGKTDGVLNIEVLYHEAYQKRAHEEQ